MSFIELNIELADSYLFKELGVAFDKNVQGYSFCPSKRYELTKQAFWCTKKTVWTCVEQWKFRLQWSLRRSSQRMEIDDPLKNNSTNFLLNFDDPDEKTRNWKASLDIPTARRHRSLSTIYNKYNLIHQNEEGRDDELWNTPILLFKPPRDVMQVSTRNALLVLGSEVVDSYRDATADLYNHLLTKLSLQADDRLRFCTNSWSFASKLHIPDRFKHIKSLDNEQTNYFFCPSVPAFFWRLQKSFFSVMFKSVQPVSPRMHNEYAQKNPAKHKKTSRDTNSKRKSVFFSKPYKLEAKKKRYVLQKCL